MQINPSEFLLLYDISFIAKKNIRNEITKIMGRTVPGEMVRFIPGWNKNDYYRPANISEINEHEVRTEKRIAPLEELVSSLSLRASRYRHYSEKTCCTEISTAQELDGLLSVIEEFQDSGEQPVLKKVDQLTLTRLYDEAMIELDGIESETKQEVILSEESDLHITNDKTINDVKNDKIPTATEKITIPEQISDSHIQTHRMESSTESNLEPTKKRISPISTVFIIMAMFSGVAIGYSSAKVDIKSCILKYGNQGDAHISVRNVLTCI